MNFKKYIVTNNNDDKNVAMCKVHTAVDERCETRQHVGFMLSHCLRWGEDAQGQKKKETRQCVVFTLPHPSMLGKGALGDINKAACGIHAALSPWERPRTKG